MINLLKNEFIKSYKKKGIIIMIIIMFFYGLLTNFIYKNLDSLFITLESELYSEVNKSDYDLSNKDGLEMYISDKTYSDLYDLKQKYGKDSWQYSYIEVSGFYDIVYEINSYENKYSDDLTKYNEAKEQYQIFVDSLNKDWKEIVKEDNAKLEKEIELLKDSPIEDDTYIKSIEYEIEKNNIRLEYDIPFGLDYKNINLNNYIDSKSSLLTYEKEGIDKLSEEQKENYQSIRETYLTSEYALKNDIDITSSASAYSVFNNFFGEYLLMLIIMIFMISGSITSHEYNNGTIKLLLLRPFSRTKILLSKYLTSISSIFISFIIMFVIQLIIGGVLLGFSSLSNPVLVYSTVSDSLQIYNIFEYLFLNFLSCLPMLILLTTLVFAISTIFGNTALAVILGFVGYMGGNIFTQLLINVDKWWKNILIFFNWDFSPYIFNAQPFIKNGNVIFSLIICCVYLILLLVPTFIIFKRKDINNA